MKRIISYISLAAGILSGILPGLSSCSKPVPVHGGGDQVELSGVQAVVYDGTSTRAPALDKENYVGRSRFNNRDVMVLTNIQRTVSPIAGFSYYDIEYIHEIEAGQSSGGWTRDDSKGYTAASSAAPERIYWSDAANPHTYIGYCLPQQPDGAIFDWGAVNNSGTGESGGTGSLSGTGTTAKYYGSLGDPSQTGEGIFIDYTDSLKICHDDLLLTYSTDKVAEVGGSVAKLYFRHALANVRVIVNISGFSSSSESADSRARVTEMDLKDMPVMYKWSQTSWGVEGLTASDQDALDEVYGLGSGSGSGVAPRYGQKKDIKMWIPRTEGEGSGVGRQFMFYALAVPGSMQAGEFVMSFNVKYQDPMNPWKDQSGTVPNMIDHRYRAVMKAPIEFRAGYCTTVNISLNHSDEEMTVGAEYMDWQQVETPDQGELKKNPTMLTSAMLDRNNFTILGDDKANEDDATWLYVRKIDDGTGNMVPKDTVDIYGNDGSSSHPYKIATAQQLVSFAYEVKQNGVSFKNKYVELDANLVMQPKLYASGADVVSWCGIGDKDANVIIADGAPMSGNYFDGYFVGGGRTIHNLNGSPFFYALGPNAVVENLIFSEVLEIDGRGIIANDSRALICAVSINGDVKQSDPGSASTEIYSGTLVGINGHDGGIISCSHVGNIQAYATGKGAIGGLVGYNRGLLISCYHSGKEKNLATSVAAGYHTYPGVGEFDSENSYAFSCYFDKDIDIDKTDYPRLVPGRLCFPLSTMNMQSKTFVDSDAELPWASVPVVEGAAFWEKHYSLNKAIDIFAEALSTNSVPKSFRNQSHREWFERNCQNYKYTFIPATYPTVR